MIKIIIIQKIVTVILAIMIIIKVLLMIIFSSDTIMIKLCSTHSNFFKLAFHNYN